MQWTGLEADITALMAGVNLMGGYPLSLVCTEQGLLLASAGEQLDSEMLGGLTALFDDIVLRAQRDLGLKRVDELTLMDEGGYRYVIRPLPIAAQPRLFLVVQVPQKASWRQNTNVLSKRLVGLLEPWMKAEEEADAV